jgi:hypothetical protein
MGHRPAVTNIGAVKIGRFAAVLVYTNGDLLSQRVQVNTAGMAASENIFHQNLGICEIRLIPTGAAAKGVHLHPIVSYLFTFLCFVGHAWTPIPNLAQKERISNNEYRRKEFCQFHQKKVSRANQPYSF